MNLHEKKQNELVLLSPLKLRNVKNGKMVLTRKFIDGVMKYVENWPGKVVVLAEETHGQAKNLDDIEITLSELSFQVQTVSWQDPNLTHYFKNARLVLCALDDWQQIPIPSRCVAAGVPAVCITEYTIKTRRQIICSETANPFLRLRRIWWTTRLEKKRRQAIGVASGIQCNGTPTYFDYQSLNDNRHLFFDSRVEEQLLATDSVLQERTRQLQQGSPLRLAFSGRLVAMKGAHHLPKVACELRRLGVSFTFDIYGDGVLASKIKSQVDALNLGKYVQLRGILNFSDELIPTLTKTTDLFVCCHPQGDPSCTYLETMACGVPIVGYDNEAFIGLAKHSGLGWTSPIDEPKSLAHLISELNKNRQVLVDTAFRSRDFAAQHTFSHVFHDRIDHLLKSADLSTNRT